MGLKEYFAQFDEQFIKAEVTEVKRGPLPDGEYKVQVEAFLMARSRQGKPQLQWSLKIIDGEYKGRTINKYNGFDTPEKLGYLKVDLLKAGLKITKLSDLADKMGDMFGKKLLITVKQNGDYRNVYIEKELNESNQVEQTIDVKEDDLPF
ncbi:DUF669 domain-containing protein [Thermoactinomyces sp. CICC 10521]|uniref:DUF669 domain-containing protein n=1 Tax=Thermoactinomyces sp. CICC 10521 TaxID=2767426 RepID=UPI0018DB9958|nr:DUF669 domain-containing protein [Thermoactinomyces sp. CICC 10521]MBH8609096.1 DUF669 domain-containing protein [Thermoactinomyces sp. CICC 10521]